MNVYEIITARILEALAAGTVPWRCPFRTEAPKSLVSGKPYRGINALLLGSMGHESNYFITFKQARDRGGNVKRGERGCPVVFWSVRDKDAESGAREKRFVLRFYTVFNAAAQCEGIDVPPTMLRNAFDPIEACETIVRSYANPPRIEHGGSQACYVPSQDTVKMPAREAFVSAPDYYSTIFHELGHSTEASHRLARKGVVDGARFASHAYSFEELVAECGAAFLCAHAGIAPLTIENSAAYIGSWVRKLQSEPRWIVQASAEAAKAADLILGQQARGDADAEAA